MGKDVKRVLALGYFDGVHKGHAELLKKAVDTAKQRGEVSCALTFDTHPEALITGNRIPLLNTVKERADLMRSKYGVEEVIFIHFDDSIMKMKWKDFLDKMLVGHFNVGHVVAGYDFHFGHRGEGNPARLRAECSILGIGCDIIDRVEIDGITVSSTYIRKLIAQGDMERAKMFLGHPHFVTGHVIHGRKIGHKIGIPTANIEMAEGVQEMTNGVYITRTFVKNKYFDSITNVGRRPTVSQAKKISVETNIFDFDDSLYGEHLKVEFYKFLRPEESFPSIQILKEKIDKDILDAKEYFKRNI